MECSWKRRRKVGRRNRSPPRLGEKWRGVHAPPLALAPVSRRVNAPPTRLAVAIAASASAIKKKERTRDEEIVERRMGGRVIFG